MKTRLTERDLSRIVRKVKGELNEGVLLGCTKDWFKTPQNATIDSDGVVTFSDGGKCFVKLGDGSSF